MLQSALQMQQNGLRIERCQEAWSPENDLQFQAEQGLSGRERKCGKAGWLQIRCKCSQTGAFDRHSGLPAILVAPLRATTSERRLFGERR